MPLFINITTKNKRYFEVKVPNQYLNKDHTKLKLGMKLPHSPFIIWKTKARRVLERHGNRFDTEKWWNNLSTKQQKTLITRYHSKTLAIQQYLHMSGLEK
jgi:hypothetical protein